MEIYQLLRRGEMHKDFCEDFLIAVELSEQYAVYGVFDGCSTGTDSHLASSLIAKVVKAELECLTTEDIDSMQQLLADAVYNTMSTLRNIRNDLMLQTDELLSTMILLVVDKLANKGAVLAFGDGVVAINGQIYEIDQNNSPDYLAYYLDELENIEDFTGWLASHSKLFPIEKIEDISVSTDGVSSFQKWDLGTQINGTINPGEYLTKDTFLLHNKSMLSRKCNILKTKHQLLNQDDIALIRLINYN